MNKTLILAAALNKSGPASGEKGGLLSKLTSNAAGLLILSILGCAGSAWLGTKLPVMETLIQAPDLGPSTLRLLYAAAMIICITLSLPLIINMFYMSDDLPELIVMPLTPMQIVIARLINLCPLFIAIALVATLPIGIAYAVTVGAPASFYVAVMLAFPAIPVIALSLAGIIVIVLLTFVGALKNRDHLRVIGAILAFCLFIAYIYVSNVSQGQDTVKFAANTLNSLGKFAVIFPVNLALADLMEGFSVLSILIVIGCMAIFAAAFLFTADRLYLKGALSMMTTSGGGHALSSGEIAKESRKKSSVASMVSRDFKMVRRNPAYLLNGFLYPFALPLLMGVVLTMSIIKQQDQMSEFLQFLMTGNETPYVIALSLALYITLLAVPANVIINSSLSREGESFLLLKQYPIDWKDFISAKQRLAMYLSHASASSYTLLAGLALLFMGVLNIPAFLYLIVIHLCLMVLVIDYNIMHDINHPHLVWESEAAMLKKVTGPVAVLCIFTAVFGPIGLVVLALFKPNLLLMILIGVSLLVIVGAVFMNIRLYRAGVKALEKL